MGIFRQFPYSNFHEMNMDELIEIVQDLQDAWTTTSAEWSSMRDFINNYFDNLDVSDEVYAALVKMANSGLLNQILDPTISSTVTDWLTEHYDPSTAPSLDTSLTIAGAAADAKAAGLKVMQAFNTAAIVGHEEDDGTIICSTLYNGWYSTTDGHLVEGTYKCSGGYIPVKRGNLIYFSNTSKNIQVLCFDADMLYLGYVAAKASRSEVVWQETYPDTAYIALNVLDAAETMISITPLQNFKYAEYPFTDKSYLYCPNHIINSSGSIGTSSSFDVVLMPVEPGDKIYANTRFQTNMAAYSQTDGFMSFLTYTSVERLSRIYTVPEGCHHIRALIFHTETHGGNYSDMYAKISKSEKILVIGDSITWLDGATGNFDGSTRFLGYQKVLEKDGYEVNTAGYNGATYAVGSVDSIYTGVVTNALDVSNYSIIVLMGGLNDILYSIPLGEENTSYEPTNTNAGTFNGALAGIITYIRAHNTTAKIILCSTLKSEASSRSYAATKPYNDAIKHAADLFGCYLLDISEDMNITPFTDNFDAYHYDNTHLNKQGMILLGELVKNAVEYYLK